MNAFFNFQTKVAINPLENIEYFYTNPHMPDNQKLLKLADKIVDIPEDSLCTTITKEGFIVTLFPIEYLIKGDCTIKWRSIDSFVINNSIWCRIVGDNRDVVRVDTVNF
jgi:hypothetical protein